MDKKKPVELDGHTIPISKFDLSAMSDNPTICMIAKRRSGKSWVCRAILHKFRYIPVSVIIAPTDKESKFYGKFFPDSFIHYEYRSDLIESLLHRQESMITKSVKKYIEKKKCDPRMILLMDDCLAAKGSWMRDKPIMELFYNGRHKQITFILTMQFPLGISPELRANFDYIFLLAEDFISNKKRIYEHYAGMFPHFTAFCDVFDELTKDFGCMVISNSGARTNFFQKVFYYKADYIKQMEPIGCKQFRDFDKNNYNKNWKDVGVKLNLDQLMDKKNKSKIKVAKMGSDV